MSATGRPRYCAIVAGFPSWSRRLKSGAVAPGGRTNPAQPVGPTVTASRRPSPRAAMATPMTAAAAQSVSVSSA